MATNAVPTVEPQSTSNPSSRRFSDLPDIVTEQEFAAFMGREIHAVRRWDHEGVGPKRINFKNRTVVYRKEAIVRWFESLEADGRGNARLRVPERKRKVTRNRKVAAR